MAQLEAFVPSGDDDIDTDWRRQLQQRFTDITRETRTKTGELARAREKPNRANVLDLGRREQLCAPLTWSEVWADPGRYEALVLQGHIEEVTDGLHLLTVASPLDVSLLASGVPLAQ